MRSFIAIFVFVAASTATSALAQDTGETTREVVGFTPDGKVAVRATSQGERVVDGSAKSYWYEVDEAWSPKLGTPESRHRRGGTSGLEHPIWKKADAEPLSFEPWIEGPTSPNGNYFLVTATRTSKRPGDAGWVCTTTARTILMSRDAGAAFNVGEASATGTPATRESGASCPGITTEGGWSKDGKTFVVSRYVGDSFGFVAGSTDSTDDYPRSPLRPQERLDPLGNLPVGPARTAWEAVLDNDVAATRAALTGDYDETGWTKLALAWAAARVGDASTAKKLARKADGEVKGDPIGLAMLGGAYALAGDSRRVKRTLDRALETADDWTTYVRMALILEDVDLSLFNQVLIYGLSTESGKANAEPWAWRMLIEGLSDAGLAQKGAELLGRMPEGSPVRAGAEARLALAARDVEVARNGAIELLWSDNGNCDAYLLGGRADLLAGSPASAFPLLSAGLFCDPESAEAAYFLSELHRAAGSVDAALAAATTYLNAAPPRRNDDVRDARRDRIDKVVRRFQHDGLALVSLTCRPLGPAFLCQGTAANRSRQPIDTTKVQIYAGETLLGESELTAMEPGEIRSFGVRVETLEGTRLLLGRDEVEREINAEQDLKRGW